MTAKRDLVLWKNLPKMEGSSPYQSNPKLLGTLIL
jgi:hypothetical protein